MWMPFNIGIQIDTENEWDFWAGKISTYLLIQHACILPVEGNLKKYVCVCGFLRFPVFSFLFFFFSGEG